MAGAENRGALGQRFRFLLEGEGQPRVILRGPDGDALPTSGAPRVVASGGTYVALKDVDAEAPGAALRASLGASYTLYGASGVACRGEIASLHVARRVIPHFSEVQRYTGDLDGDGEAEETPVTGVALANEIWEAGRDGEVLVGALGALTEGATCAGARYAIAASADSPNAASDPLVPWVVQAGEGDSHDDERAAGVRRHARDPSLRASPARLRSGRLDR